MTTQKLAGEQPFISFQVMMKILARQTAERHKIPKSLVEHPKGVICKGDPFMTEKLKDPDYVPYCGPCTPMQRLRRVVDGFECPACGNKSNWDLTKFNNNKDVEFEEVKEDNPVPEGELVPSPK